MAAIAWRLTKVASFKLDGLFDHDFGGKEGVKVLTVFGTRPEAIELALVLKELERRSAVTSKVCVTAEHRVMLNPLLTLFNIRPD